MSRRHKDEADGGIFNDAPGGAADLLPAPPGFRSGFVAVLGRPNVGKSTIVNALVGQKVSIVSDRPQTTRRRIAGVVDAVAFQLVLLDLPGFQKPFDALTERMQRTVDETLKEVDAALVVLNAAEMLGGGDKFILAAAQASATPFVVALNKVDLVHGGRLQGALTEAETLAAPAVVHAVSAKTGHNLHTVLERLVASMPEGPRYFPSGEVSDQPLEMLITELVREQALRRTRDEVPHAIAVELSSLVEREDKPLLEVEAILIVESESQKGIVIGKGGAVVKQIGTAARREIEAILGTHVFLSLRVKVRRHWRRDDAYVERLL